MVTIKFSLDIHPRKTTSYFLKNDRSFLVKRRVTFQKTTGHFSENDGLFFTDALMLPNIQRHIVKLILRIDYPTPRIGNCENSHNRHPTRAYVRAHNRSFLFFAVTSVTRLFISSYIPNVYVLLTNKF